MSDYKQSALVLNKNTHWKEAKKVLLDMRSAFSSKKKVFTKELTHIRKSAHFPNYRLAYLVDDPQLIANLELYIQASHLEGFYKYFSTIKAAIHHLEISQTASEVEEKIEQLEHEYP